MSNVVETRYAKRVHLSVPYSEAVEKVIQALKSEGFGVLTEIDMQATLKQKLGAEVRPYVILGACHPPSAQRTLETELDAGLLLPCNIVVYEDGEESEVAIPDPITIIGVTGNPALRPIASEAKQKLDRVLEALRGPCPHPGG